jgi:hypothetical protein
MTAQVYPPGYRPLILADPTFEYLESDAYRHFLCKYGLETGVRLVLHRHARRADWPYIDTKFNPNTGSDLPAESYEMIYPWLLGRGMEALVLHLESLDMLDLSPSEKEVAKEVFPQLIEGTTHAILEIFSRYKGRCPFRIGRSFEMKPLNGSEEAPDPGRSGAGDIFCAKALLLSASPVARQRGVEILDRIADHVKQGLFILEPAKGKPRGQSQCGHMLFLAVPALIVRGGFDEQACDCLFRHSCQLLEIVLDRHFDPATRLFSEYVGQTGRRSEHLDPGHCAELVGLGLSAIHAMEVAGTGMSPERSRLFARAKHLLPEILTGAIKAGFNELQEGIFKAVNNRTGEIIDDDMPWWNLPEAMRAALFAAKATACPDTRSECLAIYAKCHNAYFRHYLNPDMMLFPFQTRSGKSGEVLDCAPAIPEGDPLYHSNISFLDILSRSGVPQKAAAQEAQSVSRIYRSSSR